MSLHHPKEDEPASSKKEDEPVSSKKEDESVCSMIRRK